MERTEIVKIAIDAIRHGSIGNYSAADTGEAFRNALIELNGGSTKVNAKTFHRGNALFDLVETILPTIIEEGLSEDNPIFNLVDYRNILAGDENEFDTEGEANFVVADVAAGIQGVRRQRISDGSAVTVSTTMKIVRVYEGLNRLLSGRVDFGKFVEGVATSFKKAILADAYAALAAVTSATAGLSSTYVISGSYSESTLITLIQHVEASTGKTAVIYGTKSALRKITTASISSEAKTDVYNMGFYGKFNGTDMVALKQSHTVGTDTFAISDSILWIIASDDKPIKFVNEGEGLLIERDPSLNNDLTQEYVYGQMWGTAVIAAAKYGMCTLA